MPTTRRLLILLLLPVVLASCAGDTAREAARLHRAAGSAPRIALMPPDLTLARLSAGGSETPMAAWTLAAERNLTLALMAAARERGLELTPAPRSLRRDPALQPVWRLHRGLETAILTHRFGKARNRLPAKGKASLGWSLGLEVAAALRRRVRADYALFVSLTDTYASPGRQALGVATVLLIGLPLVEGGRQQGLATLVDLRTGAVVWARHLDRSSGDLREAEPAHETAAALLKDLPQ